MKENYYIGLAVGEPFQEPPQESGYARVPMESFNPAEDLVVFPDAAGPGYGLVTHYGLFDCAEGGVPLLLCPLPEPVDVHAGVIPLIREGRLLRGVDVSARCIIRSASTARSE